MELSLEHLDEHKFVLNDTNIELIDDYTWDLSQWRFHLRSSDVFRRSLLVSCYLKQLLHMNLAHNKLMSKLKGTDRSTKNDKDHSSRTTVAHFEFNTSTNFKFNQ